MQNRDLSALHQALSELCDIMIPMTTAMKVRRIVRALVPHLQDVEAERRKLASRYAKKDAEGKPLTENNQYIFANDEDRETFVTQVNELMDLEWEPPERLTVSELGDREVRPRILINLGEVLEE
jgi:hypothetical protein